MTEEQQTEQQKESDQLRQRRENFEELKALGVTPYPHTFVRSDTVAALVEAHGAKTGEELETTKIQATTAGRVLGIRSFGKANFVVISDGAARIQVYLRKDALSERDFAVLKLLDFGDFVGVEGHLFRTKTNELSIWATRLEFLAKCFIPMPEKWHGLQDIETRYRQRYLDLIVNPDSRRVFEVRSRVLNSMRAFLNERGYLEVETPMMQPLAGGALARPFVTHHNTLDMQLFLRIAPELYLKRLVVGGLERVYEINRNFRNEGISTQHNPEFTMLEFYWAYSNYEHLMDVTEEIVCELAEALLGEKKLSVKGSVLDLSRPWPRLTMAQALETLADVPRARTESAEGLLREYRDRQLDPPPAATPGGKASYGLLLSDLFETLCEEKLSGPVFIIDHPVEISPLSKQKPSDPRFTERFELYMGGMEIANAFSELNDPDVQAERFRDQLAAIAAGDAEAHRFDADYVRALEHGMPPAGGEGIGIDRLTMLFADRPSIRDVILFPLLRPERVGSD